MENVLSEGLILTSMSVLGGALSLFYNVGLACWFFSLGGLICFFSELPAMALFLIVVSLFCYKKRKKNM